MTNIAAVDTDFRAIGDTTLDVYRTEFTRTSSPMLGTVADTYAAARPHTALFLAQAFFENRYETTGHILGPEDHNPVSLRPERLDDKGPYGAYVITAPDGGQFLGFRSDADCAREWKRRLVDDPSYKGGVYARTRTLAEMVAVYAPSGDVHPVTGLDNADAGYLTSVVTMLRRYAAMEGAGTDSPSAEDTVMGFNIGNRPLRIAAFVGHADTSGGNSFELGKNREVAKALVALAKQSSGFDLRYAPGNLDSIHPGSLDDIVYDYLHNGWMKDGWLPDIVFANHHEGGAAGARGVFFIYPDSWGLVGRKVNGDYTDIDVRDHAGDMAVILGKAVGMTTRYVPPRGMSERETHVGADLGARLGFFGALSDAHFQQNCCVFISECGNYSNAGDLAIMNSAGFAAKEARGLLEAIASLAKTRGNWTFDYKIGGNVPPPAAPTPQYPAAKPIAALADNRPYMITDGKSTLIRANLVVKTTKATPRLMYADTGSERIGPDIAAGETFSVDYVVLNPDGSRYWYTPWATRVKYDDTEIIDADAA